MKKLAALVLVLILCFSVSIGGTYAIQNGATGTKVVSGNTATAADTSRTLTIAY